MICEVVVENITRRRGSTKESNPGYRFHTNQGVFETEDGTNINHLIPPEQRLKGKTLRLAIDRRKVRGFVIMD